MQYSWWGVSRAVKHSRVVRRPCSPLSGSSCSSGLFPSPKPILMLKYCVFLSLPSPVPSLLPLTQPLIFNHNLNGCLGCGCGGSESRALASGYKVGNKFEEIKLNIHGGWGLTREKCRRRKDINLLLPLQLNWNFNSFILDFALQQLQEIEIKLR